LAWLYGKFFSFHTCSIGLGLELKKEGIEFEFNLNQVHLPLIPCNYMIKNYRLHSSGYSDTRGATTAISLGRSFCNTCHNISTILTTNRTSNAKRHQYAKGSRNP
jgi:hypothetical protein